MINRTARDIQAMDAIVKGDRTEIATVDIASYRYENITLPFVYNLSEEPLLSQLKFNIGQIYDIFTKDKQTVELWSYLIEKFENLFNIDFLMFVSYIYMKNMGKSNRKMLTEAQVIATLIREVGYDIKVGEDL